MTKKLLLLSVFSYLLFISGYAQPVINKSLLDTVGTRYDVYTGFVNHAGGQAGADVTWDFSGDDVVKTGKVTVVDPIVPEVEEFFDKVNYARKYEGEIAQYEFFTMSDTLMEIKGYYYQEDPKDSIVYFLNKATFLGFPFEYKDSVADVVQGRFGGGTFGYEAEIKYDGYGTLKTPNGTYSDVARVQNFANGEPDFIQWFVTKPSLYVIMEFYHIDSSVVVYDKIIETGTTDTKELSSFSIYPNPAAEFVKIESASLVKSVSVISATGLETVLEVKENTVDVSALPAGIYLLSVEVEDGKKNKMSFVKQ